MSGYAPPGMYAWDLWVVRRGAEYHLFHLQAPKGLHPELRHEQASVGHAVSRDLRTWERVGTALEAGPPGSWDDRCIWTGSVLEHEGVYSMLYTGRRRGEGLVQRIGLARSEDLMTWTRHPDPVLCADAGHYQTDAGGPLRVEDWRDPYLFRKAGRVHALITARTPPPPGTSALRLSAAHAKELAAIASPGPVQRALLPDGPLAGRGCLALATSDDPHLLRWTVEPPLFAPGAYGMIECPQYLEHEGRSYLFFSTWAGCTARSWAKRVGGAQTGLHAFVADGLRGDYRPVNGTGVVLGTDSGHYASRLVADPEGRWVVLSWMRRGPGKLRIAEPALATIDGDRVTV